jgi:hypothetical protein
VIQSTVIEIASAAKRDWPQSKASDDSEDPDRILAIIRPVLAHIAGKAA